MRSQLRGKFSHLLAQGDRTLSRARVVGDTCKHLETGGAEQCPPRRAGETGCQLDCREPARAAMLERLAQRAEVFARLAFEPLGETPVQRSPRLSGKLRQGLRSDEVVGRLQRRTRIEHDTAGNEVCSRRDDSLGRPFGQRGRLGHGQRTTRNDKESEQPADVRTGATQPSAYELLRGSLGACCSGEDSEPERRAVGLLPDLCRRGDVQLGLERHRQGDPLLTGQPVQLDPHDTTLRQGFCERIEESPAYAFCSCCGEDRQPLSALAGGANEVVAESKRALVDPVEVVDREQRLLERAQSPMGGLEDAHRLERGTGRRPEEERLEWCPLLGDFDQGSRSPALDASGTARSGS